VLFRQVAVSLSWSGDIWVLPIPLLVSTVLGLVSVAAIVWSVWTILQLRRRPRPRTDRVDRRHQRRDRWLFTAAGLILLLSVAGRFAVMMFLPSGEKASAGDSAGESAPTHSRAPGTYLDRPDGSRLFVQSFGAADPPALILTHGWGTDAELW
jgi:hypothetical protein